MKPPPQVARVMLSGPAFHALSPDQQLALVKACEVSQHFKLGAVICRGPHSGGLYATICLVFLDDRRRLQNLRTAAGLSQAQFNAIVDWTAVVLESGSPFDPSSSEALRPDDSLVDRNAVDQFVQASTAYRNREWIRRSWPDILGLVFSADPAHAQLVYSPLNGTPGVGSMVQSGITEAQVASVKAAHSANTTGDQRFMCQGARIFRETPQRPNDSYHLANDDVADPNRFTDNAFVVSLFSGSQDENSMRLSTGADHLVGVDGVKVSWRRGQLAPLLKPAVAKLREAAEALTYEPRKRHLTLSADSIEEARPDQLSQVAQAFAAASGQAAEDPLEIEAGMYGGTGGHFLLPEAYAGILDPEAAQKGRQLENHFVRLAHLLPMDLFYAVDEPGGLNLRPVYFADGSWVIGAVPRPIHSLAAGQRKKNIVAVNVTAALMPYRARFLGPAMRQLVLSPLAADAHNLHTIVHECLGHFGTRTFANMEAAQGVRAMVASPTVGQAAGDQLVIHYEPGQSLLTRLTAHSLGFLVEECLAETVALLLFASPAFFDVMLMGSVGEDYRQSSWSVVLSQGLGALRSFMPAKGWAGWGPKGHSFAWWCVLWHLLNPASGQPIVRVTLTQENEGPSIRLDTDLHRIKTAGVDQLTPLLRKLTQIKASGDGALAEALLREVEPKGAHLQWRDLLTQRQGPAILTPPIIKMGPAGQVVIVEEDPQATTLAAIDNLAGRHTEDDLEYLGRLGMKQFPYFRP